MAIPSIFVVTDNNTMLSEFCSGAKKLADHVTAVVFGDEASAKAAAGCSADKIIYCPVTPDGAPEDYALPIAEEVKAVPHSIVLVNNSIRGQLLAGKLSVHLDTAVINSANALSPEGDQLVIGRMVYGGTAQRKEVFSKPYGVVTIAGGMFDVTPDTTATADIRCIEGAPSQPLCRLARDEKKESVVNLAAAKRIVDVGRGFAAEEDLDMCRKLAKLLDAEVGCSRPVAENNKWMPKACYMGITGVQVKPNLIIALGVSGQVQHIGGINKSRVIVAINKDKAAPIFKNADFGLVGDMYKILPALIDKFS